MSIWGVQRVGTLPTIVKTVGDADVTLTAGADTVGFTPSSPLIAPFRGSWAYYVQVFAAVALGSSAPSALVVKLINATPTTLDTETIPTSTLVNSAIDTYGLVLVGTASATLYFPTGDTPTITFNPTGQNATLSKGSRAVFGFVFVGD